MRKIKYFARYAHRIRNATMKTKKKKMFFNLLLLASKKNYDKLTIVPNDFRALTDKQPKNLHKHETVNNHCKL